MILFENLQNKSEIRIMREEMVDNYRHKGLRKQLVDNLREKNICDEKVLAAINEVPRHLFLGADNIFDVTAYEDKAFPIGEGQTISHPSTVAYQTFLLQLSPGEKVLEIGTGSGYQAAVLLALKAKVYSVERQKKLFDKTKTLLHDLGYGGVKMFFGDGFEGIPAFEPYDKILITAAAPELPKKLLAQLKTGGAMVIPLEIENETRMVRVIKKNEKEFVKEIFENAAFVPMLKGKVF